MAAIQRHTSKQLAQHKGLHGTLAERRAYARQQAALHGLSPRSAPASSGSSSSRRAGPPPKSSRPTKRAQPTALAQSLERMGLTWPTTAKQVNARFATLSLKKHPDMGGTNQQMRTLLLDRSTILDELARSK